MEQEKRSREITRRAFMGTLGTGAMATAASSLVLSHAGLAQPRFVVREDRFGRMFPGLRPFADPSDRLRSALLEIGKAGGILDAGDALDRGPVALIAEPALSATNANNPAHPAGTTFMGQFMDHDMTFDLTSRLGRPALPLGSPNARTPAFDLDSVYGGGPLGVEELYVPVDRRSRELPTTFRLGNGGLFEDLARESDGTAIIGDPRNDENLVIAGLHAAVLLFHNKAVDLVRRADRLSSEEVFRRARQLTTWHYQWMIVHEFLPRFIGQALVNDILRNGRRFYRPRVAFIPVEFQGAAYRFGHSMVRPSYRANLAGDRDPVTGLPAPFFGMIFDAAGEGQTDPVDLRGGARARRRFIGWQTFFDFGLLEADGVNRAVKPNKLIDTRISTPLFHLPVRAIPGLETTIVSLPQRNLLRQVTWGLPSGQNIASAMEVPALSTRDLSELRDVMGYRGLDESTPLWYYVLKEAEVMAGGAQLGPVGGRIVGEVIIGLLQLDRDSYFWERGWRPTLPTSGGRVTGNFRMVDFLTFAGVDPASRGQ
jgi:hypothetical protein